jgi:STE24 endopeptidase
MACALVFILADELLTLPWSLYADFWREKQYGLMNQSLAGWLGDQMIAFVLSAVFGSAFLLIIYAVIRKYPERWWLIGTGLATLTFTLIGLVAPILLFPLFNTSTELPAGPLRDRIVALAQANHVAADHVYLVDESRQSDRISANVAGLGPTFRITLNDNLLRKTSPAETVSVMAHELGHFILGHLWKQTLALSLIWGALLWLTAQIAPPLIRYGGQRWSVRNLGDPASLPVLAGVLGVLSLLASPIFNTLIRVQESQADAFGLNAAREPDAWASAAMKLSPYRKIAPGPLEEMLFFDHPSGATRVRMAMQWKKDHVPGAQEVVPPPMPVAKP